MINYYWYPITFSSNIQNFVEEYLKLYKISDNFVFAEQKHDIFSSIAW